MGPSIGGANVLSMTNLANVPTKNPYFSFMGPSIISAHVFDGVYLYCRSSPPEGLCGAEPERGQIVFTLHFIGVGRGTGGFNFRGGNPPF